MLRRKKAVEPAEPSEDLSSIVRAASEQALTDCGNFRLSELLSLPDNLRFLRAFCVADGCFELALFVLDAQHACSAPVPSVCDMLARKTCRKWDRRAACVLRVEHKQRELEAAVGHAEGAEKSQIVGQRQQL